MTSYIQGNTVFINEFDESVDTLIVDLIDQIKYRCNKEGDKASIEFWINSQGGDSERAFSLVALMEWAKGLGVHVNTVVLSEAASSGSLVAVAGSKGYRRVAAGSQYMVHYGDVELNAASPLELTRMAAAYNNHFKRVLDHYEQHCEIPNLKKKMETDGFHVTAEEAIEWGLADGYL